MKRLLLIPVILLAFATPTISQTTEAQRIAQLEYQILVLKAEAYDLTKNVKAYEDVFKRTTEIVKASRDTVMLSKLKAIGYPL